MSTYVIGTACKVDKIYEINISQNIIYGMATIIFLGIFLDIISKIIYILDEQKDKTQDVEWKEQFKIGVDVGKELIIERLNGVFLIFAGIVLITVCINMLKGYSILEILNLSKCFIIFLMAIVRLYWYCYISSNYSMFLCNI